MLKVKGLKKLNNSNLKSFLVDSLVEINNYSESRFHLKLKGFNKCKKLFIKTIINTLTYKIITFSDDSMSSNNGCKLKKKRRL